MSINKKMTTSGSKKGSDIYFATENKMKGARGKGASAGHKAFKNAVMKDKKY